MELAVTEALSFTIRWLHVVAGIAWIGSSFYFIALDLSLRPEKALPQGAHGEAWQVHGGGFYHLVKYLVAPARMPDELTWFKWEAYTTWLSGFALLVVVYYWNASLFMIEPAVMALSPIAAVGLSVGGLALAYGAYELLCRSKIGENTLALSLVGYAFLVALTFGFTHVFSGRGAFIQIGALIGTIMVANVFVVIIPNQKKVVATLVAGGTPDPKYGKQAKQRSVHNNYLTLPVILLMISNHYPLLYATKYNWLIVAIVLLLGPVIRHFFNSRHAGQGSPWWTWGVAAAGIAAIVWLSGLGPREGNAAALPEAPKFAAVEEIVLSRCSMCHAAQPVWEGIAHPPKNVVLDSPGAIQRHAREIALQAAHSAAMPPGNITEVTAHERAVLAAWYRAGARVE